MKSFNCFRLIRVISLLVFVAFFGIGCADDGDDDTTPATYSGSGTSTGFQAPPSIFGYKMVQTVKTNDGKSNTIGVGKTITYQFIDSNTILGDGLHAYPTTSWSYSKSGSTGTAVLKYENGESKDVLTFTSATAGTYRSDVKLITGTTGWHEGTFEITNVGTGTKGYRLFFDGVLMGYQPDWTKEQAIENLKWNQNQYPQTKVEGYYDNVLLSSSGDSSSSSSSGSSTGSYDCNNLNSYWHGVNDIQVYSQCQTACVYYISGSQQGAKYCCDILAEMGAKDKCDVCK